MTRGNCIPNNTWVPLCLSGPLMRHIQQAMARAHALRLHREILMPRLWWNPQYVSCMRCGKWWPRELVTGEEWVAVCCVCEARGARPVEIDPGGVVLQSRRSGLQVHISSELIEDDVLRIGEDTEHPAQ